MNRPYRENEAFNEAKRRVRAKAKFFKHLYIFAIVNIIWAFFSLFRGRPFMPFPAIILWGIGLAIHYLKVFGLPGSGVLSREWEDREIKKEMDKLTRQPQEDENTEEMKLKELHKNYKDSDLV